MSDLQCPATFHVVGPGVTPERHDLVHGAPIAAVHAAVERRPEGANVEVAELDEDRPLDVVLVELSDLYRGLHVLVLPGVVSPPVHDPSDELVVRIDADGRSIERVDRR